MIMPLNFRDHAHALRQAFIRSSHPRAQKLHTLREGKETEAEREGWKTYHQQKSWVKK